MNFNINNYKDLLKVTGLFSGVQGLNTILNIIRSIIAANLLGPIGKGLNDTYNDARELLHTMTNCGMDIAGIRGIAQKVEAHRNEKDEALRAQLKLEIEEQIMLLRTWILLFAIFGAFVCICFAEPISRITFSNTEHILGYILLAPAIGLSTMICGEMTILKATRRLKALASVSVINVLLAFIITLPFYRAFGKQGVIPAIVCLATAQMIAITFYSYKDYKPKFCFEKFFLKSGTPMMKVGIAFTITNIVSHGAQLLIKAFIIRQAGGGDIGLSEVGLYGTAYSVAVSYACVIFASLDNEFFPRLSSIFDDLQARRDAIWRQVRVSLLLAIPCAIGLYLLLPWLLPLLFTNQFDGALRMAQFASIGLIFRAIYYPIAYIPLAAGHSRTYMLLELLSYLVLLSSVLGGYYLAGLDGAGIGLTISIFIDTCVIILVGKIKYKI